MPPKPPAPPQVDGEEEEGPAAGHQTQLSQAGSRPPAPRGPSTPSPLPPTTSSPAAEGQEEVEGGRIRTSSTP